MISYHGAQFTSIERENCKNPQPNVFQRPLEEFKIEHIKARVKHPQTNGMVERLVAIMRKYYKHFGTWEKVVEFYNFKRPHMSLETDRIKTPYQAFIETAKVG